MQQPSRPFSQGGIARVEIDPQQQSRPGDEGRFEKPLRLAISGRRGTNVDDEPATEAFFTHETLEPSRREVVTHRDCSNCLRCIDACTGEGSLSLGLHNPFRKARA